ncbi:hypothetical protein ID866_11591 [Astraeus odoratus]|nr:hypothetical protein ID866_11591 [Astraeus odoratus]
MSSSSKNTAPINWQEALDSKLEKFWQKWAWEAKEAKRCKEAKEAEKRAHEAVEAEKRVCEAEVQHWEVAVVERQREAEQQEAERAKEAKKQQHAKSKAGPSGARGQDQNACGAQRLVPCVLWGQEHACNDITMGGKKKKRTRRVQPIFNNDDNDDDDIMVTSTHKARKLESRVWETMAQVVDRRMGKVVEELRSLRKGVAAMAESNWDLAWVLYRGFQSVDTLVNKVQIFGAEGFLPKQVLESKPTKDELQETLREVEELQEEHLEWAMECLQIRKEWMRQEEAALTKCLKGKGKELAKESKQEEEEQGTGDEGKEGEAE